MSEKSEAKKINEANKVKRLERLQAKKTALSTIIDAVKKSGNDEALKALETLTANKGRQAGSGKISAILKALESEITIHENILFERFKVGTGDMRKIIRFSVKNLIPENRHFITYDESTGNYTLEHIGKTPPENYLGFLPIKGLSRYDAGPYGHE